MVRSGTFLERVRWRRILFSEAALRLSGPVVADSLQRLAVLFQYLVDRFEASSGVVFLDFPGCVESFELLGDRGPIFGRQRDADRLVDNGVQGVDQARELCFE